MLDPYAASGIVADIEIIRAEAEGIDTAFDRMQRGDLKDRFVIDGGTMAA